MSKSKLILVPSKSMDDNKKTSRNENGLIRMSEKVRDLMRFNEKKVEIWIGSNAAEERKNSSVLLDLFHAYSTDLKKARESGDFSSSELDRIGFVTTKMWNRVTDGKRRNDIWVSTGVHDTVIGADPEFLLFDSSNNIIRANDIIQKEGVIGCDGAMAEVRPKPSTSPAGLVKNIKAAFNNSSLVSPISSYEWRAACYYKDSSRDYPVGGHIHVGNPAKVARMTLEKRERFFNVLNKIMDELVAIPCIRLDGEMGNKRRTNCQMSHTGGFGYFGEWRTCNGRLEHRTLSGMWLIHPSLAKCVIGTSKAITDEVFKRWSDKGFNHDYIIPNQYSTINRGQMNDNTFNNWPQFPVCKDLDAHMSSKELRDILNNSRGSDIDKKMLKDWRTKIRRLSTYSKYSVYIDGLMEVLLAPISKISKLDTRIKNSWIGKKKFFIDV